MEILAWLAWGVAAVLGFLWSLVWFLISGWVSTLLQIAVLIATIYFLKYGWQQAPAEILRRTRSFGRFFWNWLRAREAQTNSAFMCVKSFVWSGRRSSVMSISRHSSRS